MVLHLEMVAPKNAKIQGFGPEMAALSGRPDGGGMFRARPFSFTEI
jgi:hypothetical protein